jgi:hypothetical protein
MGMTVARLLHWRGKDNGGVFDSWANDTDEATP